MPDTVAPRLCTYTIKIDGGFAPNPFWGYCTLAACTPNHIGVALGEGDWIVGHGRVEDGQRLVYAMKISEILGFDQYYRDPRFGAKKPRQDRTCKEKCGDNIYHWGNGRWIQDQPAAHGPQEKRKDTKYAKVFVSEHYYYFGAGAKKIPRRFARLLWSRQGCKYRHPPTLVREFLMWLQDNHEPGIYGEPREFEVERESPACVFDTTANRVRR